MTPRISIHWALRQFHEQTANTPIKKQVANSSSMAKKASNPHRREQHRSSKPNQQRKHHYPTIEKRGHPQTGTNMIAFFLKTIQTD